MLKKGARPVDKAIWDSTVEPPAKSAGESDEVPVSVEEPEAASPAASSDDDSGVIDLSALLLAARNEASARRAEQPPPLPVLDSIPVFPFGLPSAAAPPTIAPEDLPSGRRPPQTFLVPVTLIVLSLSLLVMAARSSPEAQSVICATTAEPRSPPPPQKPDEANKAPPAAPPAATATSARPLSAHAARSPAPAAMAPRAPRLPTVKPPIEASPPPKAPMKAQTAPQGDPCKGDLLCAMERAAGAR